MRLNSVKCLGLSASMLTTFRQLTMLLCILFWLFTQSGYVLSPVNAANSEKNQPKSPNVYAIIIGISGYEKIANLSYADSNAMSVTAFFQDSLGLESEFIYPFYNKDATLPHISMAMDAIVEKAGPDDLVFFYFAGHGASEIDSSKSSGKLLLYDAFESNFDVVKTGALPISYLELFAVKLEQKRSKLCLMVDACYAGLMAEITKNAEQVKAQFMDDNLSSNNTLTLLACKANEKAIECTSKKGGVFTYFLLHFLNSNNSYENMPGYLENQVATATGGLQNTCALGLSPNVFFKDLKRKIADAKATHKPISISDGEQQLYTLFTGSFTQKHLLEPETNSAYYYAKQLQTKFPQSPITYKAVAQLTDTLLWLPQDIINRYMQEKIYINYYFNPNTYYHITTNSLSTALEQITAAVDLLKPGAFLYPKLQAQKLWFNFMVAAPKHKEEVEESRHYLDEAIALDSTAVLAYHRLGLSLIEWHLPEAKAPLDKVLKLAPKWSYAYNGLGLYYNHADSIYKSIQNYEEGLRKNATNPFLYGNLTYAYYLARQYDKALNIMELGANNQKRLDSFGTTAGFLLNHKDRFRCYIELKEFEKAEAHLDTIETMCKTDNKMDPVEKKYTLRDVSLDRACLEAAKGNRQQVLQLLKTFYESITPDECKSYDLYNSNGRHFTYYNVLLEDEEYMSLVNQYCPQANNGM